MRRFLIAVAALAAFVVPGLAAIPAGLETQTVQADRGHDDGAEYVWQVFCKSGLNYGFISANQFPTSSRFEEVSAPQTGDIAWWPEFVAIFVSQNQSLITQAGMVKLGDLTGDGSRPHFYRMRLFAGEEPGGKPAEGECVRSVL